MVMDTFQPALGEMQVGDWSVFGPTSFRRYLLANNLKKTGTAASISVDSLKKLSPILRMMQVMVLRLGTATDGPGTQFALVSSPNNLNDFFLVDEYINFEEPITYETKVPFRDLFPYYIFPRPTENSLINLAFASGLLGFALATDRPFPMAAPAAGSSTYSFVVRPHPELDQALEHRKGQVEVDAVFMAKRHNSDCLFILEAKTGSDNSLAKHKLVYPVLALSEYVPKDIPIVPVYLRARYSGQRIQYRIVECHFPDPRKKKVHLSDLQPRKASKINYQWQASPSCH
jgi:hypothetical protein